MERRGCFPFFSSLFLSLFLSFALLTLSKPIHIPIQQISPSLSFTFFHISDVHLDPYSNPVLYNTSTFCRAPTFFEGRTDEEDTHAKHSSKFDKELTGEVPNYFGRYGCDTTEALFNSTLEAMVKVQPHPDFIIYTGDSPAHKLLANEQIDVIQYVAEALNTSFPGVLVIPSIGNNDVYPDYNLTCNDSKLPGLYNIYKSWIPADQENNYLQMGAFAVSPLPNLLVLSLNTIIYSVRSSNGSRIDPCGQFGWLAEQLAYAKTQGMTVYIIGHIIPGMDPNVYTPLWNPNYISDFINIILANVDVIGGMLFGHVHRDQFRMLSAPPAAAQKQGQAQQSSIVTASSFSPVYDNNPSFRLYSYDKTYALLDYDEIYMDLYMANMNGVANWTLEYSYSEYGVGPIATASLGTLLNKMQNNPYLFSNWNDRQVAQYQASKQAAMCVISAPDSADFSTCMSQGTK